MGESLTACISLIFSTPQAGSSVTGDCNNRVLGSAICCVRGLIGVLCLSDESIHELYDAMHNMPKSIKVYTMRTSARAQY